MDEVVTDAFQPVRTPRPEAGLRLVIGFERIPNGVVRRSLPSGEDTMPASFGWF